MTILTTNRDTFWQTELSGAPTKLELPLDFSRPLAPSGTQNATPFVIPDALFLSLRKLSDEAQTSLRTTLGTAFLILLQRYTGQDEFLVGVPITHPLGRSLGVLNVVPLRARLQNPQPVRDLLRQTQDALQAALNHSEVPFEALVERFSPVVERGSAPLCQAMISFAEPDDSLFMVGMETRRLDQIFARHDLAVNLCTHLPSRPDQTRMIAEVWWNPDLFAQATIDRLIGHLGKILESIAADPDRLSTTVPMLTDLEWHQQIVEWNQTAVDLPPTTAHQLFEAQAAKHPDAVAVVFGDDRWTYQQLNERANQWARLLRERFVGPDVLVGVCLHRSPELVVALLAVWKAGGAYVPLDPSNPADRLQYMLEDSQAKLLLTGTGQRHLFPDEAERMVLIDQPPSPCANESTENLPPITGPADLAYVMYTSGSTGKPKGAMILQEGLVNYLLWAGRTYQAAQGTAVPVHSSIAFDLTVTALWVPLVSGGSIELLPEDMGGKNLLAAIRAVDGRSLLKITPAHLAILAEQLGPEEAANRANVFVIGGENLTAESLTLWRDHAPATRLINEYGPTETVVGCCVHEVHSADPLTGSIPIGRPIDNTQLYVLDRFLNPTPLGVAGELYIGGSGVARGYWNRPELSRDRFLPDPFLQQDGRRLYKTGDIARYRPDGVLEYLGRVDNQVKIRGYRIELGEIETRITDLPWVKAGAVVIREDSPGNKQLVGYVARRDGDHSTADDLRAALKAQLPEYMVPTRIVFLDSLPLTSNGKVDRRALPAPGNESTSSHEDRSLPRNEVEARLIDIWQEMLGVSRLSVNDNFFELGGHSLLAIQVATRIREVFQVDLSQQAVIDEQTIATLSRVVEELVRMKTQPQSREVSQRSSDPRRRSGPCFFGEPALFGVHHAPANAASETVLVIGSPIGHEQTRAHRALKLLAESAVRVGIPAFRFDYAGTGDSAGEFAEQSADIWIRNLHAACEEALQRSGAQSVSLVGCRMGSLLISAALKTLVHPVERVILWDPVLSGEQLLQETRTLHQRFLEDPKRFLPHVISQHKQTESARNGLAATVEGNWLGYRYSPALKRSIRQLQFAVPEPVPQPIPLHVVLSEEIPEFSTNSLSAATRAQALRSEIVSGAPGTWRSYETHEKTLRAGPIIARIVDLLKDSRS